MREQGTSQRVACRVCPVCRGPVTAGAIRCYQCELHRSLAASLLADAVIPIAHAVKGSPLASDLWRYKAVGDRAAAQRLLVMLRGFLRDHGECIRRAAGVPGWDQVAVVPSGQGRPGRHPLRGIVASCLPLPEARLSTPPAVPARGREITAGWPRVASDVAGQAVLIVDDTWVSGGTAQSAAVALKRAGATRAAIVVIGRHVDPAHPRSAALMTALAGNPELVGHQCANPI
jgi:predicted amidophosphoribosyltransferase